ncbi:YitT family protein [Facklamia sp. DSM 111018]|uniref:YitT family protein n=1 Tax=Facklamia lactis TaxID=2749967 RepID=A0ABS0LRZ6_9LACT|nr:YitT family protein [Facklamia lactis]MBG9980298.1 YitT family protein [Facklamia lactis]MBG9986101.1 YitT family protein [Facklamia lactis]
MSSWVPNLNLALKPWAIAYSIVMVTLGCIVYAAGVNSFVLPNHFGNGGVAGIAIIFYYLKEIPTGTTNLIVNAIILAIGYRFLDMRTLVFTIYAMLVTSWALNTVFPPIFISDNILISAMAGGIVMGIGLGMIIKGHGSSAGTDIIAMILKKYTGLNFATGTFILNMSIVLASSFVIGAENTFATIFMKFLTSKALELVTVGFSQRKSMMIITENPEPIAKMIIESIDRGITVFKAYGYYSRAEREVLYIVVSRPQVIKIERMISAIDSNAFITVTDVQEVIGQGFTFYNTSNKNRRFYDD